MTATDVKAVIVFTSAAGKLGRSVAKNLADGYRIGGLDRGVRALCVVPWPSHRIRARDARLVKAAVLRAQIRVPPARPGGRHQLRKCRYTVVRDTPSARAVWLTLWPLRSNSLRTSSAAPRCSRDADNGVPSVCSTASMSARFKG